MAAIQIYFAGCITSCRDDVGIYHHMIEDLKQYGQVLTEFVGDKTVPFRPESQKMTSKEVHEDDVGMLTRCHCVVAEVTQPSLGVGYELGRAVAMGKRILCLYRVQKDKVLSKMIRGAENGDSFQIVNYHHVNDASAIFKSYFANFPREA